MKIKEIYTRFKRGYHRPTSLPLWKLTIVYFIWVFVVIIYILAMLYNLWFVVLGIVFQNIAMILPLKWDTESWKEAEKGKKYIEEYEQYRN